MTQQSRATIDRNARTVHALLTLPTTDPTTRVGDGLAIASTLVTRLTLATRHRRAGVVRVAYAITIFTNEAGATGHATTRVGDWLTLARIRVTGLARVGTGYVCTLARTARIAAADQVHASGDDARRNQFPKNAAVYHIETTRPAILLISVEGTLLEARTRPVGMFRYDGV